MAKIAAVLDRLVREVGRFDPEFTLRPETPERLAAAEKCMGEPLPDGYREFLERIGRTHWPFVIGNVVDHRSTELPARFVPFGRRENHAFDTVVFVRNESGKPDPDAKDVPIEWCERERGRLQRGASIEPISFADWLSAELTLALRPSIEPEPLSSESVEEEQTRTLLQALIAGGALELADTFDEDAAVLLLAPTYGDSERFYETLLDCPGIEEVFISEDDVEIRFEGPRSL